MDIYQILVVFFLSAVPLFEARYAIPLAIHVFDFPPAVAFAVGICGNIIPVIILLRMLDPVVGFLSERYVLFEKFFAWLFQRTRRHTERFERWGSLALIPFVAIPLPVTGAWTASFAAFVFGIRFKYALPTILAGIILASLLTTLGVISLPALVEYIGGSL
jgi:uncharacterized membrane protein